MLLKFLKTDSVSSKKGKITSFYLKYKDTKLCQALKKFTDIFRKKGFDFDYNVPKCRFLALKSKEAAKIVLRFITKFMVMVTKDAANLIFILDVQRAGYFIQNEDLGFPDQSPGDADSLSLTLGQLTAALTDL